MPVAKYTSQICEKYFSNTLLPPAKHAPDTDIAPLTLQQLALRVFATEKLLILGSLSNGPAVKSDIAFWNSFLLQDYIPNFEG